MSATVPTTAPPHAPIAALPDERIRFQHPELPPVEEVLAYFERSREARWFSNGGPCAGELTTRLEERLGGDTRRVLVANATLGLRALTVRRERGGSEQEQAEDGREGSENPHNRGEPG